VAIRYETFMLLTTSLFVAPLLLLRSEESTRLGVKWLHEGMFPPRWPVNPPARAEAEQRWRRRLNWLGAAIGIAVGFRLGYPAAKLYLFGHEGWYAFARGVGFGLATTWLASALAEAGAKAIAGALAGPGMGAAAAAGAGAVAGPVAALAAGVAAATGAGAVVVAGAVGAVAGAGSGASAFALARAVFVFMMVPGLLLGFWLVALIFRMIATVRHTPEGYQRLPDNVRRLALCKTPVQQPELLPGLPADHPLRFSFVFASGASNLGSSDWRKRFGAYSLFTFAPIIYFPAWAYRFILKSTLWFWWILFVGGGAPRLDGGIEGLRADAYRKASAWVGIATAIFAVVGFGFGFGWLLKPLAENLGSFASLPTAVALLVLVDWKSVPIVQWVTLAAAASTIAIVIWTQGLYVDWQNDRRAARVAAQLPWLGHFVKWKTGFGAVGIALLMLNIALYANAVHHWLPVSDWAAGWLHLLYGAAATRLAPPGG